MFHRAFELRGYQAIIWLTQFVFRALFVYTTDGVNKVLSIIYTLIGLICLLYLSSEQLLLYILCWHHGAKICLDLHRNLYNMCCKILSTYKEAFLFRKSSLWGYFKLNKLLTESNLIKMIVFTKNAHFGGCLKTRHVSKKAVFLLEALQYLY